MKTELKSISLILFAFILSAFTEISADPFPIDSRMDVHCGGGGWSRIKIGSAHLYDLWGDESMVFAVGCCGTITANSGEGWSAMDSGTDETLRGIFGLSSKNVFAVGNSGVILNFDGASWSRVESGVNTDLYDVWGWGSEVFALGDKGVILHYDGSGRSAMDSGFGFGLYGIWGRTPSDIYAVGDGGIILHYDGTAWSSMKSAVERPLYSVWGTEEKVYAAGIEGFLQEWDGNEWKILDTGTSLPFTSIWAGGTNDVHVAGASGFLLNRDETSLYRIDTGTTILLEGIFGIGDRIILVGQDGWILERRSAPDPLKLHIKSVSPQKGIAGRELTVEVSGGGFTEQTRFSLVPVPDRSYPSVSLDDLKTPCTPEKNQDCVFCNEPPFLEAVGDYLLVGGYRPGGKIIRISDPANPVIVSEAFQSICDEISLDGATAYLSCHENYGYGRFADYITIADLTDPFKPEYPESLWNLSGRIRVQNGFGYYMESSFLEIFDMTIPSEPDLISALSLDDFDLKKQAVCGNYVYIAAGESGMVVVDVSDPNHPQMVGHIVTPGRCEEIALSRGHAFIADAWGGLCVVDVGIPRNPYLEIVYSRPLCKSVDRIRIRDDQAWLFNEEKTRYYLYDIRNPSDPRLVASPLMPAGMVAATRDAVWVANNHCLEIHPPPIDIEAVNFDNPSRVRFTIPGPEVKGTYYLQAFDKDAGARSSERIYFDSAEPAAGAEDPSPFPETDPECSGGPRPDAGLWGVAGEGFRYLLPPQEESNIRIRDIWGDSPDNIYMVDDGGGLRHFDGVAWSAIDTGVTGALYDLWGNNPSDIYACGEKGILLHYDGNSWTRMIGPFSNTLHCVWADEKNVFVGGNNIFMNFDGIGWTAYPVEAVFDWRMDDIHGDGNSGLYALLYRFNPRGSFYEVLSFADGSWTSIFSEGGFGDGFGLYAIHAHEKEIFVAGAGGIRHYDGSKWENLDGWPGKVVGKNPVVFKGIWKNGPDMIAVGTGGQILNYDGNTLCRIDSPTRESLWGVWGMNDSWFVVGDKETVLYKPAGAGGCLEYRYTPSLPPVNPGEVDSGSGGGICFIGSGR